MNTIDQEEVAKFSALATKWWDEKGPFKPLHIMNPCRVKFVRDSIYTHFNTNTLSGLTVLDIGCGGGLLTEPLARLDATMTGVDASEKNIEVASQHAKMSRLNIEYIASDSSKLVTEGRKFDVVLALEIIEHVNNPDLFLEDLAKLLKPGGICIISTLNKTAKSYLFAIIGAEYILRWLPVGTHDWNCFFKPADLVIAAEKSGFKLKDLTGMVFNPFSSKWSLSDDLDVNYFASFTKG